MEAPMRVRKHPILGDLTEAKRVTIEIDGHPIEAREGEPILAAVYAHGFKICRTTAKRGDSRGLFCGLGRCTDCVMVVDGVPNVRTCVTPVRDGMRVETQKGRGRWEEMP